MLVRSLIPFVSIPFLILAGCASEEKKADAAPTHSAEAAKKAPTAAAKKEVPAEVARLIANFQRVQFGFDSSDIDAESQAALKENAEIMQQRPDVKVEIQGHADERGTNEYNLALGDKRAQGVRDYLVRSGIDGSRVTTVSYGEEKPVDESSTETGWSKNRRAEFRVTWSQSEVTGTTK